MQGRVPWIPALLLLAATALPAAAEVRFDNVSQTAGESHGSRIAGSPEGVLVVAWAEQDGTVRTRACVGHVWRDAVSHGPGGEPTLCYGLGAFHLAFTDGPAVVVRSGDGSVWGGPERIESGQPGDVHHASIATSLTQPIWPEIYLTWSAANHQEVWFCEKVEGAWSVPERIVVIEAMMDFPQPLVRTAQYAGPPMPRVYYLEDLTLWFMVKTPTGWNPPVEVMPWAGADFDVAVQPFGPHQVLTLGPQPSCPCNSIHFCQETTHEQWSEPVDLTVREAAFNWPQFPSLAVDPMDGTVRAFWFQQYFDEYLQLQDEELYYKTWDGSEWTDQSELFDGRAGGWTAIALDGRNRPAFAWAEGEYGERDVWAAWDRDPAALDEIAASGADAVLRVYPNPFRDSATIETRLGAGARVVVEVLDAAGREIARLVDGNRQAAGPHRLAWDGRDARGVKVPAGVYFLRLDGGTTARAAGLQRAAVCRLP